MEWTRLLSAKKERDKSSVKKTSNDKRSPFKADFDTVCNCTGLRRLQDKAQVFPLERGDYARTRLTHSIEVMSIAESLGVHAIKVIEEKENPSSDLKELLSDIPIILRAAALLHDMGNPPFGHLGEDIISEWFREKLNMLIIEQSTGKVIFSDNAGRGSNRLIDKLDESHKVDFENFEGNAQLLRLVSKLSYVVDEHGMNLTYPVLATIIKYPCSALDSKQARLRHESGINTKKAGYFCSEKDFYDRINNTLGLNKKRYPLTYLLEAADDIAYLTADIEDAHKKGIINFSTIEHYFNEEKYDKDRFILGIRDEIKRYKAQGAEQDIRDLDNYVMQRLRIYIKGNMISEVMMSFENNYKEIMAGSFDKELLLDSGAKEVVSLIKEDIEFKHIYYCKEIIKSKIKAHKILSTILDVFVLSVFNAEKNGAQDDRDSLIYNMLSENYKFMCDRANHDMERNGSEYIYNKLHLVTDVVSGMTDSYARDVYELISASN